MPQEPPQEASRNAELKGRRPPGTSSNAERSSLARTVWSGAAASPVICMSLEDLLLPDETKKQEVGWEPPNQTADSDSSTKKKPRGNAGEEGKMPNRIPHRTQPDPLPDLDCSSWSDDGPPRHQPTHTPQHINPTHTHHPSTEQISLLPPNHPLGGNGGGLTG
jgi:hypothetical protein